MKFRSFVTGFLVGSIFFSGLAFAGVQMDMIQVSKNTINLKVDGNKVDSDNFLYEGRTYVQMREIAEMLGKDVGWDGETSTASINKKTIVDATIPIVKEVPSNYMFDLTDSDINYAIDTAKGDTYNKVMNHVKKEYRLKPKPNFNQYSSLTDVELSTPFKFITELAAVRLAQYEEFTFEEGKKYLDMFKKDNEFILNVTCHMYSSDGHRGMKVIIKQGENILRPIEYGGIEDIGEVTSTWPKFPAYEVVVSPIYSLNNANIDFTKSIDVIVVHAAEVETVYTVNLSDYK